MNQSVVLFVRRYYHAVTFVACGVFAVSIVSLNKFLDHAYLDNLLVFLIAPIFFASMKFRTRVYLKTTAIVGTIAILSVCYTTEVDRLESSLISVAAFLITTIFFSEVLFRNLKNRRRLLQEKQELIEKLEKALADVKTLGGLLPICSSCKKIRDDNGYWNQLEEFFDEHSDMKFSHSFCPDCLKKLYPSYSPDENQTVSQTNRD